MQYTLRNYTKKTFTQQELLDLQDKGVEFVDNLQEPHHWNFNHWSSDFYAVSGNSMQLFLSLVEGSKKEAAETLDDQFPAFVPLTEMQLKVVGSAYMQWNTNQEFEDYLKHNEERIHNEIIGEMKREVAEKAMKEAEEARRKAEEEEKDWVSVGEGVTFEHDGTKFVFLQISPGVFKVFDLRQSTGLPGNRYTDEVFARGQRVKISSII